MQFQHQLALLSSVYGALHQMEWKVRFGCPPLRGGLGLVDICSSSVSNPLHLTDVITFSLEFLSSFTCFSPLFTFLVKHTLLGFHLFTQLLVPAASGRINRRVEYINQLVVPLDYRYLSRVLDLVVTYFTVVKAFSPPLLILADAFEGRLCP